MSISLNGFWFPPNWGIPVTCVHLCVTEAGRTLPPFKTCCVQNLNSGGICREVQETDKEGA